MIHGPGKEANKCQKVSDGSEHDFVCDKNLLLPSNYLMFCMCMVFPLSHYLVRQSARQQGRTKEVSLGLNDAPLTYF